MSKNSKKSVDNYEPDIWRPLADFLADMIAKYANEIDFDSLPDPDEYLLKKSVKEAYQYYSDDRNKRIKDFTSLEYG